MRANPLVDLDRRELVSGLRGWNGKGAATRAEIDDLPCVARKLPDQLEKIAVVVHRLFHDFEVVSAAVGRACLRLVGSDHDPAASGRNVTQSASHRGPAFTIIRKWMLSQIALRR